LSLSRLRLSWWLGVDSEGAGAPSEVSGGDRFVPMGTITVARTR
jgi:hypothetical protein